MSESRLFKAGVDGRVVQVYAHGLVGADLGTARFDGAAFSADALAGLGALELKDRVRHIARALDKHLGPDVPRALGALLGLLDTVPPDPKDKISFTLWPMAQYVEDFGVDHFDASVAAMKRITQRFSCEFAVRPFLVRYPERMLAVMHAWAVDPDVHVRRNASEGIRPRLPWGMRLQAYVDDPTRVFGVLAKLRKDPEEYVRRSVSNCLNDIAKDHPGALMAVLAQWDADPDAHTLWIKKRALRSLVKAGDAQALALLGYGPAQVRVEGLRLDAPAYRVGDTLGFSFDLVSTSDQPQDLMVDYRVHFVKASGQRRPKVFKLKAVRLGAGDRITVHRKQHLKPISTRRYHAGTHGLDVQVNGVASDAVWFKLGNGGS